MCCNNNNRSCMGGLFQNYQTFWIVVIIAIVIVWVHYTAWGPTCLGGCCAEGYCGDGCGNNNCCC